MSVTEVWCGNVLYCSHCLTVWVQVLLKLLYFYFIGRKNNFEKHPNDVLSVFPKKKNKQRE